MDFGLFLNALGGILTDPIVLLLIFIGVAGGIVVGALPGLTATMGVALMIPFTFGMEVRYALPMLLGIFCSAVFGGSISAILLNTPGTPSAAATVLDGYPMAKKGEAARALNMAVFASTVGGLVGVIFMIFLSPQISKMAINFNSPEFFSIAVLGLTIIILISGDSMIKGFISGTIGMLMSTIGLDPIQGYPRFTFGSTNLYNGFELVPVLIGLFAVSEAFVCCESLVKGEKVNSKMTRLFSSLTDIKLCLKHVIKSGIIGTLIGAIPGAGGDIACFVAYGEAKRSSKNSMEFGTGIVEGVSAPESANNAVGGGAMIPMLTLGVPGDPVTAVLIGALMIHGIQPGPLMYRDHMDVVYVIFASLVVANIVMFFVASLGMPLFIKVISIGREILTPVIFILCIVGGFALRNNFFDVWTVLAFGVIGYLMQKTKMPISPILLSLILGPMAEQNLRRMLIVSNGSYAPLFTSPICLVMFAATIIMIVSSLLKRRKDTLGK